MNHDTTQPCVNQSCSGIMYRAPQLEVERISMAWQCSVCNATKKRVGPPPQGKLPNYMHPTGNWY